MKDPNIEGLKMVLEANNLPGAVAVVKSMEDEIDLLRKLVRTLHDDLRASGGRAFVGANQAQRYLERL